MAAKFRGEVYPRDYIPLSFSNSTIISDRECIRVGQWIVNSNGGNPQVLIAPYGPNNDRGPDMARDDNPLQNGYIYDWDNPGPRVYGAPEGFTIVRIGQFVIQRANFRAWTVLHATAGVETRCSNDIFWTSSTTVERTGQGTINDWRGAFSSNIFRQNEVIGSYTQSEATVPMNAIGR
jgi:hypothetical protein